MQAGADNSSSRKSAIREILDVVVLALVIALTFQTLLFQPFRIPSESMKPTAILTIRPTAAC
jgi:signal peptidase I